MTRREWIAMISAAPSLQVLHGAPEPPVAPVSIAKCATYDEDVTAKMAAMFDQLGGLEKLVRNKTVTDQGEHDRRARPALSGHGARADALHASQSGRRHRLPAGPRRSEAHTLRGKRLGHRRTAGGRDPRFRLESARAAIRRPRRGIRKHQRARQEQEVRALQISRHGVHVPRVRDEPGLRRYRRIRQPGQAQESCRLRRDALLEELLRLRPRLDLRRRRRRGRAQREAHQGPRRRGALRQAAARENRAAGTASRRGPQERRLSRLARGGRSVRGAPHSPGHHRRRGIHRRRRGPVDPRRARRQARSADRRT